MESNEKEFVMEQEDIMAEVKEYNNQLKEKEKEFVKEQEETMQEVKEHNEEYNKVTKELEQERKDSIIEMKEYNSTIDKETKQPTVAGGTADTEKAKEVKPPMNVPNTSIAVGQKEDITKRKNAINYLSDAKDSITKTLNINGKLHWTKEEIQLLRRVRAISKELETIINTLKVISGQQAGMVEIQQQLAKQPVANIKVEYATSGEFSIIQEDTGSTLVTGNKEEIKGFLKGYIAQQATAGKTE